MKSLLFIFLIYFSINCYAQSDSFTEIPVKYCMEYDASGNMIRKYICYDTLSILNNSLLTLDNTKSIKYTSEILTSSNGTIKFFPNPTKDVINVEITEKNLNNEIRAISIFDENGKEFFVEYSVKNVNSFDLSNFHNGTYFVKITYKNSIEYTKFLKME